MPVLAFEHVEKVRLADHIDTALVVGGHAFRLRHPALQPVLAAKVTLILAFNVTRYLREVQQKLVRFAEINSALREHGSTNESVAQNVETIARMSEHVYNEISQAAGTASALNDLAEELIASVAGFRVSQHG